MGVLVSREYHLQPDGQLHVHFLDVQQGDAVLLITPSGKQILIDGGPNMETLEYLGRFLPFFDRQIELLVLTHPHEDHLTALPEVLRRYQIAQVLLSGSDAPSGRYAAMLHELSARKIPVILAGPQKSIVMEDGVSLDCIWPRAEELHQLDPNNASVVVRVLFGKTAILLPGDIEQEAERAILLSGKNVRATVLKVPHHGSSSSSSTGFLLAVRPELGIVSAGPENRFSFPHSAIVERYEKMGIPLRTTAKEGTISLTFAR
ncbi:hypothetical protein A2454_02030 [Candidatus Peribacteria bacterium RIFOXYC2_FULL_55_14]|nr:MAG: Beta-lactamase domain protein [Candidatus Peribacteria bacterium GW2011_GWC2_54_8]OGJ72451.1 MAG: hypothetical protein A2198_06660 [Candidatus Peribacteria bacterium RIFOXYA1_FULL_56_14]OGJ73500.1 MAG: hypothetical protein A2217_02215 [Candidatus Peribacteria bacterium RIFOXYA2_FULL_55_28]OGJ74681.1 MAG: hypothetical protein A2384_03500 [Candidatus Peribacteria bacterium RIFOXYB1_FULL_54_35]OGJ76846.1 MAG: hypothetical protein A2327_06990 [Candidatus Peribacteria bacterium RIFOXYB2_FULL